MKNLTHYLYLSEELQKHKTLLKYLIDNSIIDDNDVETIAQNHKINPNQHEDFENWKIDFNKLNKVLEFKGIGEKSLANFDNLDKRLVKLFNKKEKIKYLKTLIKNNDTTKCGIKKFDEFKCDKDNKVKNIWDICNGWEDIAKQIAEINFLKPKKSSAAMGKFEILLRLILTDADQLTRGDVHCYSNDENGIPIEVKASQINGKNGARVNGQSEELKDAKIIYKTLFDKITEFSPGFIGQGDERQFGVKAYFQNYGNVSLLSELLNSWYDTDDLLTCAIEHSFYYKLVESVFAQYSDENSDDILNLAKQLKELNKGDTQFIKFDKEYVIDPRIIINIVGTIQLYLYRKHDAFKYIIVFNNVNGDYTTLSEEQISNIKYVLSLCSFQPIGTGGPRQQSCRIGLKGK